MYDAVADSTGRRKEQRGDKFSRIKSGEREEQLLHELDDLTSQSCSGRCRLSRDGKKHIRDQFSVNFFSFIQRAGCSLGTINCDVRRDQPKNAATAHCPGDLTELIIGFRSAQQMWIAYKNFSSKKTCNSSLYIRMLTGVAAFVMTFFIEGFVQ